MYMVAVLPPPEVVAPLEDYRRRHDPAFHRIAAHLRLVGPFEQPDPRALDAFDTIEAGPPLDVVLGPAENHGEALVLPVLTGGEALEAVRAQLAAVLHTRTDDPRRRPALLVGRFGIDAERELVARAMAAAPPLAGFRVDELTLLFQDERGLWHPVRRRRLRASGQSAA